MNRVAPLLIISAVNRDEILSANLMRSPDVGSGAAQVIPIRGCSSAADAYNAPLASTQAKQPIAFVHQDVYLPEHWVGRLRLAIAQLEQTDPRWGVLGVVGMDLNGDMVGEVWDNGTARRIGKRPAVPVVGVTIDEIVIVLRGGSDLQFDPKLGFHLYASDLVQDAKQRGMMTYIFDGPVIHNNRRIGLLDEAYKAAYRHMQIKWRRQLPIPTCIVPVTRHGFPLTRRQFGIARRSFLRPIVSPPRHPCPQRLALQLGFE